MKLDEITMYTDGACRGNPGPGGWGALLIFGATEKEISGGEDDTTNNRMELMAAIQGLNQLKRGCRVSLHTDSKYVLDGITKWLPGWKKRNWKTAGKKPVKNRDLWELLDEAVQPHDVEWIWVKGHAGHDGNERADELANQGLSNWLCE